LLNTTYFLSCQLWKNCHWACDPTLLYINPIGPEPNFSTCIQSLQQIPSDLAICFTCAASHQCGPRVQTQFFGCALIWALLVVQGVLSVQRASSLSRMGRDLRPNSFRVGRGVDCSISHDPTLQHFVSRLQDSSFTHKPISARLGFKPLHSQPLVPSVCAACATFLC